MCDDQGSSFLIGWDPTQLPHRLSASRGWVPLSLSNVNRTKSVSVKILHRWVSDGQYVRNYGTNLAEDPQQPNQRLPYSLTWTTRLFMLHAMNIMPYLLWPIVTHPRQIRQGYQDDESKFYIPWQASCCHSPIVWGETHSWVFFRSNRQPSIKCPIRRSYILVGWASVTSRWTIIGRNCQCCHPVCHSPDTVSRLGLFYRCEIWRSSVLNVFKTAEWRSMMDVIRGVLMREVIPCHRHCAWSEIPVGPKRIQRMKKCRQLFLPCTCGDLSSWS